MSRVSEIQKEGREVVDRLTERLRQDAATIDVSNNDPLSQAVQAIIAQVTDLSKATALLGGLMDDFGSVPQFEKSVKNLANLAVSSILNPGSANRLATMLKSGAADFAASALRDSSLSSDLAAVTGRASFGDLARPSRARGSSVLHGDGSTVTEVERKNYDPTRQAFNTAFGVVGMSMGLAPVNIVGGISAGAISFNNLLTFGVDKVERVLDIQRRVIDLIATLPAEFFESKFVDNVRQAANFCRDADVSLTQVRSQLISLGAFPRSTFNNAKESIRKADQALAGPPSESFPLAEIFALLDEMEKALVDLEVWLADTENRTKAILDGLVPFLAGRALGASFAGLIQLSQDNLRGLIENMEAALKRPSKAIINPLLPIWRLQLQTLNNTMCGLGEFIATYLDEDPDGFIGEITLAQDALRALPGFEESIKLFISSQRAFIRTTKKILDVNTGFGALAAFASQGIVSATQSLSDINSIKDALDLFPIPDALVVEATETLAKMLEQFGFDRAAGAFRTGDFDSLFAMNALTATFSGAALSRVTDWINCIGTLPTAQQSDSELADKVQEALYQIRQKEQLAAQTFNQWKVKAAQRIDEVQLPLVQKLDDAINRLTSNMIGTPCGEGTTAKVVGFLEQVGGQIL